MQYRILNLLLWIGVLLLGGIVSGCSEPEPSPSDDNKPSPGATNEPKTCQAIDCSSRNRLCVEGDAKSDATCGACNDSSWDSGLSCVPYTVCASNQYEVQAPTSTTDRVCTFVIPCAKNEYESAPATATSDHVCSSLTDCDADEYESQAPTPTTDRICAPLTVCTQDEYETSPPTATTDRTCAPLTVCEAGQWISTPETDTSDRLCSDLTRCDDGYVGADSQLPYDGTATRDQVCCLLHTVNTTDKTITIVDGEGWPTVEDLEPNDCYVLDANVVIQGDMGLHIVEPQLKRIAGNLSIINYSADRLLSLPDLEVIDGAFTILDTSLTDFRGLESLRHVGENEMGYPFPISIYAVSNSQLVNFKGLEQLQSTSATVWFANLATLEDLGGLAQLADIGGMLYIELNDQLKTLDGLNALTRIGMGTDPDDPVYQTSLAISQNGQLSSIAGLNNVQDLAGSLKIAHNNLLCMSVAKSLATRLNKPTDQITDNNGLCPIRPDVPILIHW